MIVKNKISVVVCTLNEEKRILECLRRVMENNPDEVILVDGGSTDRTIEIAKEFTENIFVNKNSNLTKDRQIGINNCSNELIAMIDADHMLLPNDLENLVKDMLKYELDIVQSGLSSSNNDNFWDKAENQAWKLNHNKPTGRRKMIGTAPAIYKREIFKEIQFSDDITKTIDDTDFMYRLSVLNKYYIGVGDTVIKQFHFSNFKSFRKKFFWYGIGDGEFCIKHPNRAHKMLFHLLIRYPIIYPFKSLFKGYIYAMPFFIVQGYIRFFGLVSLVFKSKFN